VSIAILFVGGLAGLVATLFLHWWVLDKVFTIPAPRDGLPGQDGEDNNVLSTTTEG
jgi:hypothetical protein